jgi:hypothetical protein
VCEREKTCVCVCVCVCVICVAFPGAMWDEASRQVRLEPGQLPGPAGCARRRELRGRAAADAAARTPQDAGGPERRPEGCGAPPASEGRSVFWLRGGPRCEAGCPPIQ